MRKNPKSIVISFRLSPVVVAKAIDGLRGYDKCADIGKLSQIIKQTTLHGINYLTHALPFEPSQESQVIVHNLTVQGKQKSSIEQNILGQPLKQIIVGPNSKEARVASYLDVKSQSEKSTVTDFSMPEDLMKEMEDDEE